MDKQKTIAKEFSLSGLGLHTANKVNVTFKPAQVDSGISFIRVDLPGRPVIKADVDSLMPGVRAPRRTSIGSSNAQAQTIEHLMAVLSGVGIDNLNIEMDNQEVPGLDGSGLNFLEMLNKAGLKEQDKQRQYFAIKEPIFVEEEGSSIVALPSAEFKISYTLDYDHPLLKTQFLEIDVLSESFRKEIASARTFCLEEEAVSLRNRGFGRGANYNNTLVVGKSGVIDNTLRYPDEFVRHKILDLLGDLYLLGQPIKGRIIAIRSGHSLNLKLVQKIAQQRKRYSMSGVSAGSGFERGGKKVLDRKDIMKILPHRDPFLFVDEVICLEEGKHATGVKYLAQDDYFFKGHFPGRPVMPGVLMVEALAQVGGIMMLTLKENRGKLAFFMTINNIKFRKTVVPGDKLVLDVTAGKIRSKSGQVHAEAFVDGKLVVEADMMFAMAGV